MSKNSITSFNEIQKLRQWWIWPLILLIAGLSLWSFIQQIVFGIPFGSNPAPDLLVWILFVLFGIGLPWLLLSVKLTTEIQPDYLFIRLFPFKARKINIADIKTCEIRKYRPIREYGGWGIRWSPSLGMAYIISGNHGVQLELNNGKKVLIGSQKSDQLSAAINAVIGSSRSSS